MQSGQTYRAQIEVSHVWEVASRKEHKRATLMLKLRTPNEEGHWAWGEWSQAIPLPETVCTYLWQGAKPQAPTLREIRIDDGRFVVVLDVILELTAKHVSPLEQDSRAGGCYFGIRSLITVSVFEKSEVDEPYRQVSRPVFLDTGG